MDKITSFSSKTWCAECRRYIVNPSEAGIYSDGVCPHYGWALLKTNIEEKESGSEVFADPVVADQPILEKKEKPILGQGGGIVAQSAVQFSHDLDEADESDPQRQRQKDAGMMGMLVGVMLGLGAVVAFFMFSPHAKSPDDGGNNRAATGSDKPSGQVVGTRDDVVNFINEFSELGEVDEILKRIRFPAILEPSVSKWCEAYGTNFSNMKGLSVIKYSEDSRFGARLAAVTVGRTGGQLLGVVFVEIADDGGMRIDWEILVGAADRYWREFVETRPGNSVPLWVSIHRTSIIGVPLPEGEDPDQWMALKVMSPSSGASQRGHFTLVKKGGAFGDYVENYIPWNTEAPNGWVMAVNAHFTNGELPMLMIDELRYPGGVRSPIDDEVYPLISWEK